MHISDHSIVQFKTRSMFSIQKGFFQIFLSTIVLNIHNILIYLIYRWTLKLIRTTEWNNTHFKKTNLKFIENMLSTDHIFYGQRGDNSPLGMEM